MAASSAGSGSQRQILPFWLQWDTAPVDGIEPDEAAGASAEEIAAGSRLCVGRSSRRGKKHTDREDQGRRRMWTHGRDLEKYTASQYL